MCLVYDIRYYKRICYRATVKTWHLAQSVWRETCTVSGCQGVVGTRSSFKNNQQTSTKILKVQSSICVGSSFKHGSNMAFSINCEVCFTNYSALLVCDFVDFLESIKDVAAQLILSYPHLQSACAMKIS